MIKNLYDKYGHWLAVVWLAFILTALEIWMALIGEGFFIPICILIFVGFLLLSSLSTLF